jgi:small subunit ribosomal protein S16
MLKIRLRRSGKKNHAQYRIVVAEHTAPIQGKFIDLVGSYDPHTKVVNVKKDLVLEWVNKGALPSNTVAKLLNSVKITHPNIVYIKKTKKASKQEPTEETPAPAKATEEEPLVTETEAETSQTEEAPTSETTQGE